MILTPKARANIFSALATVPFLLGFHLYRDSLSMRAWAYLGLASFLVGMLTYVWVYHRQVATLPAAALPRPELNLVPERIPNVVWLALFPPVVIAVLLWWVTLHGSPLPWRDTWLGPSKPAVEHKMYVPTAIAIFMFNCLALWHVVYGLARWHGMARSRAYPYRRERLLWAVGNQWLMLTAMVAWASGMNFRMPAPLATTCGVVFGFGLFASFWMSRRLHEFRAEEPRTGTWCYFDFKDPTFVGPRGLNIVNRWVFALAAAVIAPVIFAEWLLHGALG